MDGTFDGTVIKYLSSIWWGAVAWGGGRRVLPAAPPPVMRRRCLLALAAAAAAALLAASTMMGPRSRGGEAALGVGDRLAGAAVATTVVTPPRTFHRFFDSSPFSPSGRYLAACRAPREGPADVRAGEAAAVVVVDLEAAAPRVVYERRTTAWDTQLGAQVQWGATDDVLYWNTFVERGKGRREVRGVEALGWRTGAAQGLRVLPAPLYHVSPDGAWAVSPADLFALRLTQQGYGVVPTAAERAQAARRLERRQGVVVTDLAERRSAFVVPLAALAASLGPRAARRRRDGTCRAHLFHTKFNANATRIMAVVRERGGETERCNVTPST